MNIQREGEGEGGGKKDSFMGELWLQRDFLLALLSLSLTCSP